MIREKTESRERVIDLTGPAGNALSLMGQATKWMRELGYDKARSDSIIAEMMSGDYEELISVFDREFGSFCVLER